MLMREVKIVAAHMVCERIRQAVERQVHDVANQSVQVTISLGLVELTEKSGVTSAEGFIKAADTYLYKAKHGGRNRTECDLLDTAPGGAAAPPSDPSAT
jgi:diguanylate cyclase (GGDEF)-like protein